MTTEKKEKKNTKKGPVRTGAVIPFAFTLGLIIVLSIFLLDSALKKSFEFLGTKINGAEVNIAEVVTSFRNLSLEIKGIQFTNKEQPDMNSFEVGLIKFSMLWDGLLRGKFVINEMAVHKIQVITKRDRQGFVVPPPAPEEIAEENKKVKEVLGRAQKQFDGNIFGDIAGVLSGKANIDEGAKSEMKSQQRLAALQTQISNREKEVSELLQALPTKKDFDDLQRRFNQVNWNGLSQIQKAPKILKEIEQLKKQADKMLKAYSEANKKVNAHLKYVNEATREIPQFVKDDIDAIQKRMKIPSIDPMQIAQMLFGNEIVSKVDQVQSYQGKVKEYLPPKKEKSAEVKVKKPVRKVGLNYKFGTPQSYPLLWIKKIMIDSKTEQGQMAGFVADITDDQRQIGKPTIWEIKGDFPGAQVRDVKMKGQFDHRSGVQDEMNLAIGSYPVKDKALSNTNDVKFIIAKADAKSVFVAKFIDEKVSFKLENDFRKIQYDNSAKSEAMDEILKGVAETTDTITLNARAQGKWDNLKWEIKSNLAEAIQKTVNRKLQAKIEAMKKQIQEEVNRQIAGQKAAIEKQINDAKAQYEKAIADGQKQLDNFKKQIDSKKKSEEKKAKKSLEKQGKDLLKKFKL